MVAHSPLSMRLSVRVVSALCVATMLLPLGVSAAATAKTMRLRDIVKIVQSNAKPLSFDLTLKGVSGKNSGMLKMTGSQNGNMKSLSKAAAETTFILDVKFDDATNLKAKVRLILANKTFYFRLDEFSTTNDLIAMSASDTEMYMQRWFSFPVEEREYNLLMNSREQDQKSSLARIEQFFAIVQSTQGDRTRYTVTIPEAKKRRLLAMMMGASSNYASREYNAEMRKAIRSTTIKFELVVETVRSMFDLLTTTTEAKTKIELDKATFTLNGKVQVLPRKPVIQAPRDSTPWEEFIEEQYGETVSSALESARNAQRKSDVNTILNATYQYAIDNDGNLPADIPHGNPSPICATNHDDCDGLSLDTLTGSYLVRIPRDPLLDSASPITGYEMVQDVNGRITVSAPMAEKAETISVTR